MSAFVLILCMMLGIGAGVFVFTIAGIMVMMIDGVIKDVQKFRRNRHDKD